MKATLEEDMEHWDESSGYGSDTSSLVEEGSPNYASHETGVIYLTSPSDVASNVSEEELEESAESAKTAAEETTCQVVLVETTRRAALAKAVIQRAALGEASRKEAVAKKKAAQARAAEVVAAIQAGLRKAPQTRRFLEEELPRVAVPCQAGLESGGASMPPDALVHPHLLGVAGVVSVQAPCLPGPITPELRVRPPQLGGLADEELEPWPSLFWPCSCTLSSGPCFGLAPQ